MTEEHPHENEKERCFASAKTVLGLEIDALQQLEKSIDDHFFRAVITLKKTTGRVAVTGMGKSGHIGRKISATLSSTGTPSFFIHPGESSHGDLGMIMLNDAVLALSTSGESKELADIIEYTRRHDIPLIAITAKPESLLGKNATIVLKLPDVIEACSMDLVPTSSTVMILALGDALAVALLQQRQFTKTDFHRFHPGGKLGQSLIKVESLMKKGEKIPLIPTHANMSQAIVEMSKKTLGCTGIIDQKNTLCGIITDGDLRRWIEKKGTLDIKVTSVMTRNFQTIHADFLGIDAVILMNKKKITSLFICNDKKEPTGIVHIHDCLRSGIQ